MAQNNQQQVHPAQVAQEFMTRADMKGGEVDMYAQTFNWLAGILEGQFVVITKEEFDEMVELKTESDKAKAEAAEAAEAPEPEEDPDAVTLAELDEEDYPLEVDEDTPEEELEAVA